MRPRLSVRVYSPGPAASRPGLAQQPAVRPGPRPGGYCQCTQWRYIGNVDDINKIRDMNASKLLRYRCDLGYQRVGQRACGC